MKPEDINNAKIAFSPLNWGMGHVSRSISLINQLMLQGNSICIFCNAEQKAIYQKYFPKLEYIDFEPYRFNFGPSGFSTLKFLISIPTLIKGYRKEKKILSDYLKQNPIDYIISDQRYGFRKKGVFSIFITHQCRLSLPWYLKAGQMINKQLMKSFNRIWIMDNANNQFAGKLSKTNLSRINYIGIKSRFELMPTGTHKPYRVLILNGPKPFHEFLMNHFKNELNKIDFIIGDPPMKNQLIQKIVDWEKADDIISQASEVYSFCAYSTLMDIQFLQCKWHCIPTPGQFEQAYLYKKTLAEGQGFQK